MQNTTDNNMIKQVLQLTGFSMEQHNEAVYDTAEQYLTGFSPNYPQVVTQILKSKTFWHWWRHHWEQRDKQFIEQCYNWDEGTDSRVAVYKEVHDSKTLLHAVYLNGQVLEETFAQMFGKLTDAQHCEYKRKEAVV